MLSLFSSTQAFSSPTLCVSQPVVRASPVMMAEMPSRRAALLSAAALAMPFAAQANPEDYVGGYTAKAYEKTYAKYKEKSDACPAPGGPYCAGPGGDVNSPLIKFKLGDPPVMPPPKKEEPKKEPKKE